ncbi:MAG: nucleoside-diphosphate kinase [Ignavibacteria bacterium CG_4_8_14_3_um_filter_37_9]|nr:nucleoside-diphosphate kinase [Ignavibacteria bacterium]OIO23801.1 MAG: nucleoside-diphosphate kinase [Ignavibacteria bacterium CG1_02_37_35]PIP78175.1 MAG: nucleoside-diphosphate kinase [Ignavibacteria bacterium CG22_combo_CG10-13_8_21_14_all_37_15]PIS44160.1 MAG: nucleoside-diphosphate kinase [Ignavibacteria bacterium CG08_land_8_20_14_0_20_37_9]PIW98139.1 MAG: nucleoside-diphosphate kinase [Ignavibacteria bacterium CG_4_8_14_3_um_filter_37_9]PIX94204.1 MAG: nucleoside-diphosphate kinase 
MTNRTFAMIKPDAVKKNLIGQIITKFTEAGFKIKAMKMTRLTKESAQGFYEVHKERPFYNGLVEFMISGPVVALALEKENAVADYRKLIGATDPADAEEGTIRKLYADSKSENVVHGSDSDENAAMEIAHFFSRDELLNNSTD